MKRRGDDRTGITVLAVGLPHAPGVAVPVNRQRGLGLVAVRPESQGRLATQRHPVGVESLGVDAGASILLSPAAPDGDEFAGRYHVQGGLLLRPQRKGVGAPLIALQRHVPDRHLLALDGAGADGQTQESTDV